MALRFTLTHPLGTRQADFPDRPVDQPVTIGRSSSADVQVPSVTVSQSHCVLFVYEGHWVVQDAGSRVGTFVNGQRIDAPTAVAAGDRVTLGNDLAAPSLDVTEAAVDGAAAPQPAAVATAAYAAPAAYEAPAELHEPHAHPAHAHPAHDPAPMTPAQPFYGIDSAPESYVPRRRPKKQQTGGGAAVVVAVVLVAAFVGGAIYLVQQARHKAEPVKQQASKPPEDVSTGSGSSIFSEPSRQPSTPATPSTPSTPRNTGGATPRQPTAPVNSANPANPTTPTSPRVPDASPSTPQHTPPANAQPTPTNPPDPDQQQPEQTLPEGDPRRKDPAWARVADARRMSPPAEALAIFLDYQQSNPASPYKPEVDKYVDEALDRLWWTRLKELSDQRDVLNKRVQTAQRRMADALKGGVDAQRKKELQGEVDEVARQLKDVDDTLSREMGFAPGTKPPDPYDDQAVAAAKAKRDEEKYTSWRRWVTASVRRTRGALPW